MLHGLPTDGFGTGGRCLLWRRGCRLVGLRGRLDAVQYFQQTIFNRSCQLLHQLLCCNQALLFGRYCGGHIRRFYARIDFANAIQRQTFDDAHFATCYINKSVVQNAAGNYRWTVSCVRANGAFMKAKMIKVADQQIISPQFLANTQSLFGMRCVLGAESGHRSF